MGEFLATKKRGDHNIRGLIRVKSLPLFLFLCFPLVFSSFAMTMNN